MKKLLMLICAFFMFGCTNNKQIFSGEYKLQNSPEDAQITLMFENQEFSGSSGVNRYFGNFTHTETNIKFNNMGMTMMMGPKELMDAEQTYLKSLEKADSYTYNNGILTLKNSTGAELIFKKIK